MKYLFYLSSTRHPHTTALADEICRLARDSGNKIAVAYCRAGRGICPMNRRADSARCFGCGIGLRKIVSALPKSVRVFPLLESFDASRRGRRFEYACAADLKKLRYKGIEIGYGLLSFFITVSRDANPEITPTLREYFDSVLDYEATLIDEFEALAARERPDVVGIFGGRAFDVKPVFDFAIRERVPIRAYEVVPTPKGAVIEFFENALPQDVSANGRRVLETWDADPRPEAEKRALGTSFFEKRRNGISAGDVVYTGAQKRGALPPDWNPAKRNVVIFNSSEDEFAALGTEFNSYSLFPSQLDGIRFIAGTLAEDRDCEIWLRVHPNLKDVRFDFHVKLYELPREFPNLHVIPAASEISTYALLDAADRVVVFGSTMGVESAFWGKPTILLAGCHYYDLGVCLTPKTEAELAELLRASKLVASGNVENAIKYGHYVMDRARLGREAEFFFMGAPKFGRRFFNGVYKDDFAFRLKLWAIEKFSGLIFWRRRAKAPYKAIHRS